MEDIHQTHVEIDDLLTTAVSEEEAIRIFRQVLICSHDKKIKRARYKLEGGTKVDFAGAHIGGPE